MGEEEQRAFTTIAMPQSPISPVALHAPDGRSFLGLHRRRDGVIEIVYDRFGVRRSVWEVMSRNIDIDALEEACRRSVQAQDCLATLYTSLMACGIRIECREDRGVATG